MRAKIAPRWPEGGMRKWEGIVSRALSTKAKNLVLGNGFETKSHLSLIEYRKNHFYGMSETVVIVEQTAQFSPTTFPSSFVERKLSWLLSHMHTANMVIGNLDSLLKLDFPTTTVRWRGGRSRRARRRASNWTPIPGFPNGERFEG